MLVAYGIGVTLGGVIGVGLVVAEGAFVEAFTGGGSRHTVTVFILLGPLTALAGLWSAPWLARAEADLAQRMLLDSPRARDRRCLVELRDSRSRMVDAAEAERRRIERDLHDGAQQRILALTMTLARARAKFDGGPEAARALVREAQSESRAVLADLREVARGLHPRVLTDHGLGAALPVAAGRCPVPVRVEVDLVERPSPRAEATAYYVVCEALASIAKHADAAAVTVRAEHVARNRVGVLRLTVTDDGRGGADPEAGTGCTACGTGCAPSTANWPCTVHPVREPSSPPTSRGGRDRACDHRRGFGPAAQRHGEAAGGRGHRDRRSGRRRGGAARRGRRTRRRGPVPRGHPYAAHLFGGGHARGHPHPRGVSARRGPAAVPARGRHVRRPTAGRGRRQGRLPAQGPDRRHRRVPAHPAPHRRRRGRHRPRSGVAAAQPQ